MRALQAVGKSLDLVLSGSRSRWKVSSWRKTCSDFQFVKKQQHQNHPLATWWRMGCRRAKLGAGEQFGGHCSKPHQRRGGLDQSGSTRSNEKFLGSRCTASVDPTGLHERLDMGWA